MLENTQLFALWVILSLISFWLMPSSVERGRQWVLVFYSVVLAYAVAAPAAVMVIWMWLIAWAAPWLFARRRRVYMLWAAVLLAALPLILERTVKTNLPMPYTLGIAFATLRAVAVIMDSWTLKQRYAFADIGLTLFFFPLYTVGPIESINRFAPAELASFPGWAFVLRGLARICLGLFKTTLVASIYVATWRDGFLVSTPAGFAEAGMLDTFCFVVLSWVFTYLNFSGFCDIAIGVSRLFGLKVMENFNFPWLATNLQDFWKRWHISLGSWITRYLYFPIVAAIGKYWAPFAATFIAFALIGWWHEASATWLAWGALHGIGLCVVLGWQQFMRRRHRARYNALAKNPLWALAGWVLTISYAAWVQTFANLDTMERALAMTRSLLGA